MQRLGRMIGLRSIRRNLENEDQQVATDIEANQREIHGQNYDPSAVAKRATGGEEDMEIMSAGDVTFTVYQQPPTGAESKPSAPKSSPLKTAALLAAMAAGGAGIGAAPWLLGMFGGDGDQPSIVDTDTDTNTEYGVGFGTPEKR